jgi:hypothetical protein
MTKRDTWNALAGTYVKVVPMYMSTDFRNNYFVGNIVSVTNPKESKIFVSVGNNNNKIKITDVSEHELSGYLIK